MSDNLAKSIALLKEGGYTCVVCGDDTKTSTERGVKPLVRWYDDGHNLAGATAADRVVGKGAAFLYLLLGVSAVHALVISQPALDLLTLHGVAVSYDRLVPNIVNRTGDGICPFEELLLDISSPDIAYIAIKDKMRELNIVL